MNKKYLSVALFGALMMVSTGVFTSSRTMTMISTVLSKSTRI